MKKIISILALTLILSGCMGSNNVNENQLESFLSDYVNSLNEVDTERGMENKGVLYETEIEGVGFYGVGKVSENTGENLVFIMQHLPTKINSDGFYQTGPLFGGLDFYEDEFLIENSNEDFGHNKNYYIAMIDKNIEHAYYDEVNITVENIDYTLNSEEKVFSVVKIELEKEQKFNEDLLRIEEKTE